jgi:uncharacterized membrane protein
MIEFGLAILAFFAAHILPAATGLRAAAVARFGHRPYVAIYSLVSLAAIAWVIVAARGAPYIALWSPGPATALVPLIAMLPAALLFVAGAATPNPLSVSFRSGLPKADATGLARLLRHPILWAFFLWAGSHLVANGDLVSVILFGALALFSLAGMKRLERRARARLSEADFAAARAFTGGGAGRRLRLALSRRGLLEALAGLAVYAALLHLHGPVIGVDPLDYF